VERKKVLGFNTLQVVKNSVKPITKKKVDTWKMWDSNAVLVSERVYNE